MEDKPYRIFAKIYDAVYRDDDDFDFYDGYLSLIDNIIDTYKLQVQTSLELACGTGNLSALLLKRGWKVDGVDQSQDMLQIAKQKGINVFHGDMRTFATGKTYDLILCIFDSLNYLQTSKDMESTFNSVAMHLKNGGVFLFDLNSDYKIARIPAPDFKIEYGQYKDDHYIWLNSGDRETWYADLLYFEKQKDGMYKLYKEHHIEKAHTMDSIINSITTANLELIDVYSNFELDSVKRDSWRWFFVTRKS